MNKNKIIVMALTFAVLIAVTPLIFSKLMNSKYNQMLDDLRKQGMVIKVVEDKSTYLQTDKLLEVTIPSKLLNDNGIIETIKLDVETKFKNLPVTNVIFLGKLKGVVLSEQFKGAENDVNGFLKKYVRFVATTPNFKDYSYKFDDIKVDSNPKFGIEDIKGALSKGSIIKNRLNIKDIYVKDSKGFIEIKNVTNRFEGNEKESYSKTDFNVNVNLNRFKLQINNVESTTKTILDKKMTMVSTLGFDVLSIPDVLNARDFNIKGELKGVETELLEKLAKADENEKDMYIDKIFEKGFNIDINSNLKNVEVSGKKLGGYDLNFDIKFLPTRDFRQKLNSNNIDFVDAKLHLSTTPEIANILMNALPQSAFVFALAKKENGKVILNLEYRQGKLYSEGQPIQ